MVLSFIASGTPPYAKASGGGPREATAEGVHRSLGVGGLEDPEPVIPREVAGKIWARTFAQAGRVVRLFSRAQ
jgi:hypothetical protein